MKQRQGVLGLETAKAVMVSFLILAVIGVSILLALTSLQTATEDSIDGKSVGLSVTNETEAWLNSTGYTLLLVNSSNGGYTLTALWNATDNGAGNYNLSLGLGNATLTSAGILFNATNTEYENVSVSYTYTHSYSLGRVSSITGNVSEGLTTFFGSTGTIFSILIVIVIILAISIIIWAVGRFGQPNEKINL